MSKVKYYDAIIEMFEPLYESWMDDTDKEEFIVELIASQNKTLSILSDEIDIGISNGYTVEQQVEIGQLIIDASN